MAGKGNKGGVTIVIRKAEDGEYGHHGGARQVAYADFVTAMMAFFLLMGLLNATSEEQRRCLADFFSPNNVLARVNSGSGQPFSGRTPHAEGASVSNNGAIRVVRGQAPVTLDIEDDGETPAAPPSVPLPSGRTRRRCRLPSGPTRPSSAALREALARRERVALERAAEDIRAAVRNDLALAEPARQFVVEQGPEGLRIQLLDAERRPMFATGSAAPNERARALMQAGARVAARLPNGLAIAGHTDATPFRGGERSTWELSAERANAVRRLLVEGGIAEGRLLSVAGHAERELLMPAEPTNPANRRVAITLLRQLPESAMR